MTNRLWKTARRSSGGGHNYWVLTIFVALLVPSIMVCGWWFWRRRQRSRSEAYGALDTDDRVNARPHRDDIEMQRPAKSGQSSRSKVPSSVDVTKGSKQQPKASNPSRPLPRGGTTEGSLAKKLASQAAETHAKKEAEEKRISVQSADSFSNSNGKSAHPEVRRLHSDVEQYDLGLSKQQRQQALASVENLDLPAVPRTAMGSVVRSFGDGEHRSLSNSVGSNLKAEFTAAEQEISSRSPRQEVPGSFPYYDVDEEESASLMPRDTTGQAETGIQKQKFPAFDQNELTSRLSELALADIVPTVMVRPPNSGEVDSALETMVQQESRSRPRHGSTITPEEAILEMPRAQSTSASLRGRDQHHGSKWDPSVDHSFTPVSEQVPYPEAPYERLHEDRLNSASDVRDFRNGNSSGPALGTSASPGPRSSGMRDSWQDMSVIEPSSSYFPAQVRDQRTSVASTVVPADAPIIEPTHNEHGQRLSPRGQFSQPPSPSGTMNSGMSHLSQSSSASQSLKTPIKCNKCELYYLGFRAYKAHVCCEVCKDEFPSHEHYEAHMHGRKHEALALQFGHCPICDVSQMPVEFDRHMDSDKHHKRVQEEQRKTGRVYVVGGGNERYGAQKRMGRKVEMPPLSPPSSLSRFFQRPTSMSQLPTQNSPPRENPEEELELLRSRLLGSTSPEKCLAADLSPRPRSTDSDFGPLSPRPMQFPPTSLHRRIRSDNSIRSLDSMLRSGSGAPMSPSIMSPGRRPNGLKESVSEWNMQVSGPAQNEVAERAIRRASGSSVNVLMPHAVRAAKRRSPLSPLSQSMLTDENVGHENMDRFPRQSIPEGSVFLHVNQHGQDDSTLRPESSQSNPRRPLSQESTPSQMMGHYRQQSIPEDSVVLHVDHVDQDDSTLRPESSISNMGSHYPVIDPPEGSNGRVPQPRPRPQLNPQTEVRGSQLSFEAGASDMFAARRPVAHQRASSGTIQELPSLGYGRDFSQYSPANSRRGDYPDEVPVPGSWPQNNRGTSPRRSEAREEEEEWDISDSMMSIIPPQW